MAVATEKSHLPIWPACLRIGCHLSIRSKKVTCAELASWKNSNVQRTIAPWNAQSHWRQRPLVVLLAIRLSIPLAMRRRMQS